MVAEIYSIQHFQQNIEQQKLLKGGRNADPFVIAKAVVDRRTVVTMETLKTKRRKDSKYLSAFPRALHEP